MNLEHAPASGPAPVRARTVVFVLADGLHLLDLAGPAQVFSSASDHGAPYALAYVADEQTVTTHQGVPLGASTDWPDLTADDLVVVPGWRAGGGAPPVPISRGTLARVAEHHERGGRVVSVCAGAFALARAGLLDGRRATTHHDVQAALARLYPRVQVVEDVLFVGDGRVYTSAGIASGIDLALHLVALDHGPSTAARVARTMVVYARRNGSAAQASAMLRHRDHLADVVHRAQDIIDAEFRRSLPLGELASSVGVSERTLTRSFKEATGTTPLRYQQVLRVERATHLVEQGWTHESAAREVGFGDARMLRRLRQATGV